MPPTPKPRQKRQPAPSKHLLCRLEAALLTGIDAEPTPFPLLLNDLPLMDLKSIEDTHLKRIQTKVAEAAMGNADARYIQLYVACLMHGVDFMDNSVLDDEKAQEILHRLSLAIVSAKTQHASHADVHIPLWAVIVAITVLSVLVILLVTFFSVLLAKINHD